MLSRFRHRSRKTTEGILKHLQSRVEAHRTRTELMLIPYITVDDHMQTSLSISSEMERLEMVTNMNELAFVTSSEVSDSEGHSDRAPVEWIVTAVILIITQKALLSCKM